MEKEKIFWLLIERGFNFLSFRSSLLPFAFLLFTFAFYLTAPVFAQTEESPDNAPPPLKVISKEEKSALAAETNVKKYTILALEFMNARLAKAENLNTQQQYKEMYSELGGFHSLIDNTLNYLNRHDTDSNKVLNNFKRLEMSLRKFTPRLELIRRDLPLKYELYVRKLIIHLRQARSKAVEPLFDNSVVSDVHTKKP
ncbi:MAG: hypothetical protein ACR2MG_05245 [Pyrinomonadaceae bacterium]